MAAHSEERLKITIAQKKAIRNYYKVEKPRGHKMVKQWFKAHYAIDLPTSTISNILSSKFDRIDQLSSNHDTAKRCRPPKFPDLEAALSECILRMKSAGIDLTGAVLLNVAYELWPKIPAYQGKPLPTLSGGWVEKFKTRHGIKLRFLQVEAASTRERANQVAIGPTTSPSLNTADVDSNDLEKVYSTIATFNKEDIYTMAETELFWRLPPNAHTLKQLASLPKGVINDRVTVALACNATGTRRLPPWVIGQISNPRSFTAPGNDIKTLNAHYSSNVLGWMTANEWRDWFKWFDSMMDTRVLLILSPGGPHEVAYNSLIDSASLRYTHVEFLPPNMLYQPMELGILQNFKAHYRKLFLSFISACYQKSDLYTLLPQPVIADKDLTAADVAGVQPLFQAEDPFSAINLYMVIYWIQKAWINDLDYGSITQAWNRSNIISNNINAEVNPVSPTSLSTATVPAVTALSNPSTAISPDLMAEIMFQISSIRSRLASMSFMGDINDALPIDKFIYPPEESILENVEDFIELSTAQFYEPGVDMSTDPIYVLPPDPTRIANRNIKLLPAFEDAPTSDPSSKYLGFLPSANMVSMPSRQNSIASLLEPSSLNLQVGSQPTSPMDTLSSLNQASLVMPFQGNMSQVMKMHSSNRRKSSQDSFSGSFNNKSTGISRTNSQSSATSVAGNGSALLSMMNPLSSPISKQQPQFNLPSPVSTSTNMLSPQSTIGSNYYSPINSYFNFNNNQGGPTGGHRLSASNSSSSTGGSVLYNAYTTFPPESSTSTSGGYNPSLNQLSSFQPFINPSNHANHQPSFSGSSSHGGFGLPSSRVNSNTGPLPPTFSSTAQQANANSFFGSPSSTESKYMS